jgi:hypothetical protein
MKYQIIINVSYLTEAFKTGNFLLNTSLADIFNILQPEISLIFLGFSALIYGSSRGVFLRF